MHGAPSQSPYRHRACDQNHREAYTELPKIQKVLDWYAERKAVANSLKKQAGKGKAKAKGKAKPKPKQPK